MSLHSESVELQERTASVSSSASAGDAIHPNPLRTSSSEMRPSDADDAPEQWGRRSTATWLSHLVGVFIVSDPFKEPLRGRPTGNRVSQNAFCTAILTVLMISFAAVQAVRLRGQPPTTVSEIIPSLPVTSESMVMLYGAVNNVPAKFQNRTFVGYDMRNISAKYDCVITAGAAAVYAPAQTFLFPNDDPIVPNLLTPKAPCSLDDSKAGDISSEEGHYAFNTVTGEAGVAFRALNGGKLNMTDMFNTSSPTFPQANKCGCVEVPLMHHNIGYRAHLYVESMRKFPSQYVSSILGEYVMFFAIHDEQLDLASLGPNAANTVNNLVFDSDVLRWTFKPQEIISVQASLEVLIDTRLPAGGQVSKRVRWSVLDRVQQDFSLLGFAEDEHVQRMILEMAATYIRYTVSQPDWVLPCQ
jgi:hypothetical protein